MADDFCDLARPECFLSMLLCTPTLLSEDSNLSSMLRIQHRAHGDLKWLDSMYGENVVKAMATPPLPCGSATSLNSTLEVNATNPFEILLQTEFKSRYKVKVPENWKLRKSSISNYSVQLEDEFVNWDIQAEAASPSEVEIRSEYRRKNGLFGAEKHHQLIESVSR